MADKKKTTTALATLGDFSIANRYEGMDPELMAELEDEMSDLDPESGITCRKIKIPSGGGLAYEVQGEEETDVEYMKEINGVVVFTHRVNGFWAGSYGDDDQNKAPICSSMDGKTGVRNDTGEIISCETCPLNQFGSATDQKGNQAKGKACKNMRRLYLMMDGDPNFYLLTVPPTSIKDVNKQLAKIMAGGTPYTGLVLKFTLEKTKNAAGVEYSKVVISKAGLLPPAISSIAQEMRRQIKEQYQSMAITMDDYAAAPEQPTTTESPSETPAPTENYSTAAADDFPDSPQVDEDNLPFN